MKFTSIIRDAIDDNQIMHCKILTEEAHSRNTGSYSHVERARNTGVGFRGTNPSSGS